ncbi:(2Fe-2S)-binding protein [Streptomyces celluloflavus]|uniref:(2Fe-2S)-binding protein n=1 Tax=Streptomyces celluloflavus TaxID=58344 RepID=UPI0036CAF3A8
MSTDTRAGAGGPAVPRRPPFPFRFDELTIEAEPGQSIAAALLAAGHRSWRRTRVVGAGRGMFCGIGVCFDCLVTVNGRPNQRACLVEAAPGDLVRTQEGAGRDDLAC